MKKRSVAILLLLCTVVTMLAGCSTKIYDYDKYGDYIKLGEYKGISIDKSDIENGILDQYQSELGNHEEAKKEIKDEEYKTPNTDVLVQRNDTVTIDYVGTIYDADKKDWITFDGGTANSQKLVIGSGSYIDGFVRAYRLHSRRRGSSRA